MRSSGPSRTSSAAARTVSGTGRGSGNETCSSETGSVWSSAPTPSWSRRAATAVSGNSSRRSGSPQPHHFIPAVRALALRPGRCGLEAVERLIERPADRAPHHRRAQPRKSPHTPVERHRHLGVPVLGVQVDLSPRPVQEALERRALDRLLEDVVVLVALLDAVEVRPYPSPSSGPEDLCPASLAGLALADVLHSLGV